MHEVEMQTSLPVSTREDTNRLVKIIDITYVKADLEQVDANKNQLNAEEITQLLRLLKSFEDLFDGTIGDCDTEPVYLDSNPDYRLFNCKYYPVPLINRENFCKYHERLVKYECELGYNIINTVLPYFLSLINKGLWGS